jgi:hypothetical protein
MHNSMENFTICYEKKVYTTMVNNSINIKKMNRQLNRKKSTIYGIENKPFREHQRDNQE